MNSASSGMSSAMRRRVTIAASRQSAARSAPTKPWVISASLSSETSSASGMPRVWTSRISRRPLRSGTPMLISRSKRPGRRSAGSMQLGRVGGADDATWPRDLRPSISDSSCATTRFSTCCWLPISSRLGATASISSMKRMRGRVLLRLLEDLAQALLGLAVVLAHDLRAADVGEVGRGLVGQRLRDQRLAGAGRAVEQHALRRLDAEAVEQLRVAQRQLDHLADALHLLAQPADVLVGDAGGFAAGLGGALALDLDAWWWRRSVTGPRGLVSTTLNSR